MGRLKTIDNQNAPGVPRVVLTQGYDPRSLRTSLTATINGTTSADHPSRPDEAYGFDENGNRTMAGYVTTANNRVIVVPILRGVIQWIAVTHEHMDGPKSSPASPPVR